MVPIESASPNNSLADQVSGYLPSRVEIDLAVLAHNVRWLKSLAGTNAALMAVVKANAYGHGALAVARVALAHGADWLAVANMGEAIELRQAGIEAPILILSYLPAAAIPLAIEHDISISLYDEAQLPLYGAAIGTATGKLKLQLKVDTGMGRLGMRPQDVAPLVRRLRALAGIELEGIYTHFAAADEDPTYTSLQLDRFKRVLKSIQAESLRLKYVHAANSAALLTSPESYFNLLRPGLLLYGLSPSTDIATTAKLQPAMSWKTYVAQVKTLPAGSSVGYGRTYRAGAAETIAILPVGYADGLRRSPHTWREVLVHGLRAPLVGRVSMEKIAINISQIPDVAIGDEVVLLGKQGDDEISPDEIASWLGTINYEVLTSIAPRAPRSYKYE